MMKNQSTQDNVALYLADLQQVWNAALLFRAGNFGCTETESHV